ncbi:hypothetical protein BC829DRAFT_449785 [Chytridium lagenaria]|nr:hypothetical protein BC829DRAFT_449785 [Chytridium lagenaria]
MDAILHHIPSSIIIAITSALLYAAISRVAAITAILNYASFWPSNGFIVGAWLQLTKDWLSSSPFPPSSGPSLEDSFVEVSLSSNSYKSDVKRYGVELLKWFISDCLGHVAVIPFMLSLSSWRETWSRVRKHPAKGFLAFGCLAVIAVLEMALTALPENNTFFSVPETILTSATSFLSHVFCCVDNVLDLSVSPPQPSSSPSLVLIDVLLFRFQLFIIVVMISSLSLMVIDKARQEALADALKANNQNPPLWRSSVMSFVTPSTPSSTSTHVDCQHYMSQIINDVLDTSKFEAGNVKFAREPVDVGGIFRQVALQTREDLRTRHVTFGMHTGTIPRCEGCCFTDEMRFKQLLNNLLAHAIKVTPPGGRIDWDDMYDLLGGDGFGPGIPPDVAAIIFKPFQMSGLETSQEYSGTGFWGDDGYEEEGVEMEVVSEQAKKPHTGRIGASPGFTPETPWLTAAVNREPVLPSPRGSPPRSPFVHNERSFLATPHPDHVVVSMDEDIRNSWMHPTRQHIHHIWNVRLWSSRLLEIFDSHLTSPMGTYTPKPLNLQTSQNPLHEILIPSSPHPPTSLPISPPSHQTTAPSSSSTTPPSTAKSSSVFSVAQGSPAIDECVNGLEAVKRFVINPDANWTGGGWDADCGGDGELCGGGMLKMEFGFTALAPKPFLKADAERILREFEMG